MGNQYTSPYSKEEIKWLKEVYPKATVDEVRKFAQKHGRSYDAVINKVHKMGIKKIPQVVAKNVSMGKRGNAQNPQKVIKTEEGEKLKEVVDLEKFGDSLIQKLKEKKPAIAIPKRKEIFKGKMEESAVLLLSDIHMGKENYFVNMETGKAEMTYNTAIAHKEANRLLESIFDINQLLSKSYKIDDLYIFGLGDLVEGDIIISGQRFFIEAGVGEQMLMTAQFLASIIRELLKMFQRIHFTIVGGNHARMTEKRNAMQPWYNNFDYLAGKMLQEIFKNEPRVEIKTPESWFFTEKIYGWKYFLQHGAGIPSHLGFPYYGISRRGMARRIEMQIDIECIGHFHQCFEIPMSSKSITLVNGCWIEKDNYLWERYGHLTKPRQYYFGVNPRRARSWQFVLDLTPKEVRE
jgi:hypothetical protein